jgi:hypothetical protein
MTLIEKAALFAAGLVCVSLLSACDRAPSNVKTIQTTDCGVTWQLIPPGQRIPTTAANVCGYNTVLPDYPMQGDTEFLAQFQKNILVRVKISYDYEITDGLKFLRIAKFLGKQAPTAQSAAAGSHMAGIETAENVVIDVQLREITTSKTLGLDIVEFNPSAFEDTLYAEANKVLAERGVQLKSMTFVTIPDDQTRMAIDAATAMAVYRSKGMEELGNKLVVARAGATQVTVNTAEKK